MLVLIQWDLNNNADCVTSYRVILDGVTRTDYYCFIICEMKVELPLDNRNHNVSVQAVNEWGAGKAGTLRFKTRDLK